MLQDKDVQEYKRIIKKNYGIDLTDEEAREESKRFLDLLKMLLEND